MICGPEFGLEHVGKRALIRRALCGGKAAGRDFVNHLSCCMRFLGFKSCLADPDIWMRPAMKSDGTPHHECIPLCTDDALTVGENPEKILREVGKCFEPKEESVGPPKFHLGSHVRQVVLENGVKAWGFGSSQCVQSAVKNIEEEADRCGWKLPKANTLINTTHRPELDVSPELNDMDSTPPISLSCVGWLNSAELKFA